MRAAGCALLERIGPSFLVGHSLGGGLAVAIVDNCPELVVANILLEPACIPFADYFGIGPPQWGLTFTPLLYDPPAASPADLKRVQVGDDSPALRSCTLQADPPRQLVNIKKVPQLVIAGEASIHITWDHCVVEYMSQAGIEVSYLKLADIGIHGNGHFSYLEKNNLDVARVVKERIVQYTKRKVAKVSAYAPRYSKSCEVR